MTLKEIGEFGFIDRIRRGCLVRAEGVVKAIGDDCAIMVPEAGHRQLVTTDLLIERIHFLRDATSGFDLGHKALAVNLSDIAAMGGIAREAFVSIAIPEDCDLQFLDDLYEGMKSLAAHHAVNILGGDTTGSLKDLIINIAVTGSVPAGQELRRDAARPGDIVCVTGPVGESRGGLHLILNRQPVDTSDAKVLLEAHRRPLPHLDEGRFLSASGHVHAAIDVSDGLTSDLEHVIRASGTGARLKTDKLPISDTLRRFCKLQGFDPIDFAMAGGEDYVLLCTVAPCGMDSLVAQYQRQFGRPLHIIGEIIEGRRLECIASDGTLTEIKPGGWEHFKVDRDRSGTIAGKNLQARFDHRRIG